VRVHLVDGTYELFRQYYAGVARMGPALAPDGREVGGTKMLLRSALRLLGTATHIAYSFDTVIESFRNDLFGGYKTSEGIDPALWAQFPLAERAMHALGITVWSMVEFEADDGLAAGAARYADEPGVEQVIICSSDKDLTQCVRKDGKVVTHDRMRDKIYGWDEVVAKFGVTPPSIPDWLALVGDTADGIPGLPRWGERTAAQVLAKFGHLDKIPADPKEWGLPGLRGADILAETLRARREDALLYRRLATLRTDVPLAETLADLEWRGARRDELEALCAELGDTSFVAKVTRWHDVG
jgi:5'-3' exonuclease